MSVKSDLEESEEILEIHYSDGVKLIPKKVDLKKIYLELTTECNLDCITCIRNSWDDELGQIKDSILDKLLGELKELEELEVVHLGGFGEPTTHPRFEETIAYIKELGLELEFITNGHYLRADVVDRLLALGVDKIIVSVDAPQAEEYEKIRLNSDFEQLLTNLEYLTAQKNKLALNKPRLGFEFVAMQSNYHLLPNLMKLAKKLAIDSVLVTNLLPYTEDMLSETLYTEQEEINISDGSGFMYLKSDLPDMKLRTQRNCNFIDSDAVVIDWQGNISPCYATLHNYSCYIYGRKKENLAYHLGNIRESTLAEIWIQDQYLRFRSRVREQRFPSCTDCKYIAGCSMIEDNQLDCWGNTPTCADCLWYRGIILCP